LTACDISTCNDVTASGASRPETGLLLYSALQGVTTPAHEFGHQLGLGHRLTSTNTIMSYDRPDRTVTAEDLLRVEKMYEHSP
jgi:hypothetical protein